MQIPGRWPILLAGALGVAGLTGFLVLASGGGAPAPGLERGLEPGAGGAAPLAADLQDALAGGAADGAGPSSRAGPQRVEVIALHEAQAAIAPVEVTGRVLGEPLGKPVRDALVILRDAHGEASARTGDDGAFALTWERPAPGLLVEHPEYVDARRPLENLGEPLEVSLPRSGSLGGRVIALSGGLPVGASVHLWTEVRSKRSEEPVHSGEVEPTGRFSMQDIAPGTYALGLVEPGLPVVVQAGILIEGGQIAYADLELPPGARVRGEVLLGGTRLPVEGASVSARPDVQGLGVDMERRAAFAELTAADGSFELVGVPTGQVVLWVRTPWGHRQRGEAQALAGKEPRSTKLIIAAPAQLAGRVVDHAGEGVSGALVVRCLADEAGEFALGQPERLDLGDERLFSTRSGPDGGFDFGQVPGRQKIMVHAYAPGPDGGFLMRGSEVPAHEILSLPPESETRDLELRLRSGWPVHGVVRDEQGQPVAGVEVRPRARLGRSWSDFDGVLSDADGRFLLSGVPEGPAVLNAEHADYSRGRVRCEVAEGLEEIEVELVRAFTVRGVVLDGSGYAVPESRAIARLADSEQKRRRSVRTDEFGRFELEGLEAGRWVIDASAPGWEHPEGGREEVQLPGAPQVWLTLEPVPAPVPASVTGELLKAGTGEPIPGLRFNSTRRGTVEQVGTRFHIRGMVPGRLKLVATGDKVEPYPFRTLDLAPGAHLDLGSVELRGVTDVAVRVTGPGGASLQQAKVWLERLPVEDGGRPWGPKRLRLEPVPAGPSFRLARVPRYHWTLEVRAEGSAAYSKRVFVGGKDRAFDVRLTAKKSRK